MNAKPLKGNPQTAKDYFAALTEPHKSDIAQLDKLIRKTVPKHKPHFQAGMLAYGHYVYRGKSGRGGEWFRIGLSSRKNYISLYVMAYDERGMATERYKKRLPKAKIGRSCVTFKRLADVDLGALKELIAETKTLRAAAEVD